MTNERNRALLIAIVMIPITGLVVWLATKMARTPEGNYRLLIIGGAMLFMTLVIAVPAAVQKLRR